MLTIGRASESARPQLSAIPIATITPLMIITTKRTWAIVATKLAWLSSVALVPSMRSTSEPATMTSPSLVVQVPSRAIRVCATLTASAKPSRHAPMARVVVFKRSELAEVCRPGAAFSSVASAWSMVAFNWSASDCFKLLRYWKASDSAAMKSSRAAATRRLVV